MIKKLTNHILSYLISSNAIDDNEETKDYYRYGIEITISSLINILLIIIIGIVSGNAMELLNTVLATVMQMPKIVQVAQEQEQAHIIPQVVILPTYLIKCI